MGGESDQLTPLLAPPTMPAWKDMLSPAVSVAEDGKTNTDPPEDAAPLLVPTREMVALATIVGSLELTAVTLSVCELPTVAGA